MPEQLRRIRYNCWAPCKAHNSLGGESEQSLDGTLLVLTSPPTRSGVRVSPRLFYGLKMAGDWIKMRSDLHTHPKVVRISSALNADRLRIVGGLHAVWCLFDAHAENGKLFGYTPNALNSLIGFDGFCEAMQVVGWIEFDGESLVVPRFDAHNGQSAKRRSAESERKRNVRKTSASDADKMRTREEKRREEKSIPSLPSHEEDEGHYSGVHGLSVDTKTGEILGGMQ